MPAALFPRSSPPAMLPEARRWRPCRTNPARRRRLEMKATDAAPAKARELVMGKVTILKRGEALPQLPAPAAAAPAASPARKARPEVFGTSTNFILSPSPVDVPMPTRLLKNLILSID